MALIERYGSSIQRMIADCVNAGLLVPAFEEKFGGFSITNKKRHLFRKNLEKLGRHMQQIIRQKFCCILKSLFSTLTLQNSCGTARCTGYR